MKEVCCVQAARSTEHGVPTTQLGRYSPWLLEIVSLSRDVANLSKCGAAELGTAPPETLSADSRPYTQTHLVRESETILSATVSWPRGRVNSVCCVRAWLGQLMLVSCNLGGHI